MGMAASQARFLCLTARKSNTEYQGQQVNQQRTLLANESAGLYNRMLAMEVPVPPSSSDYYKKTYQFAPPADGSKSKYYFTTTPKLVGPDLYRIGVAWDTPKIEMRQTKGKMTVEFTDGKYKNFTFNGKSYELEKMSFDTNNGYDTTDGEISESEWTQEVMNQKVKREDLKGEDGVEFYRFSNGDKTYYISDSKLLDISDPENQQKQYYIDYSVLITGQDTGYVQGYLTKSETSGRYTNLTITNSDIADFDGADEEGINCTLVITEVRDDEAYDEAMSDYEYKKDKYDKEIQDINSKTALIQQKDKSLELKLKQLDTEQEALKNELEAVQEVINKNVESTFKTFSA